MSGYIGTQPVPQATQTRDSFTCTAGQTSFATSGYTPNFLDVYLNGVKLTATDYTASNGSDVVLASGAATGDVLEVVAYTPFEAANVTGATDFTVTGSFTSQGIDDNATSTAMTLDSSGRVGIGTTLATTKLQSKGGSISTPTNNAGLIANASASFVVDHGNDYGIYTGYVNSTNDAVGIAATRTLGGALPLSLQPFGGNVGIGTSLPMSVALNVHDSTNARIALTNSSTGQTFPDGFELLATGLDAYVQNRSNGNMIFTTNNTERMRILAGGGITFNGDTAAANALDDYEEGSYTVTATPETSGSQTLHASYRTLTYTKIGRLVKVQGNVYISSNSSAAGSTLFSLPFASSTDEQSKSFSVLGVGSYPTPSSTSLMSASGSMRAFKAGGGPLSAGEWYSIDFTYIVNV